MSLQVLARVAMQSTKEFQMMHKLIFSVSLATLLFAGCASSPRTLDVRLIRAAEAGRTQEMFELIRAGADINATDKEGWTPYLAASSMGQLDAMKMLRALGAETHVPADRPGQALGMPVDSRYTAQR